MRWLPCLPRLRLACLQVRRLRGLRRMLPQLGTVPLVLIRRPDGCSINPRHSAQITRCGASSSTESLIEVLRVAAAAPPRWLRGQHNLRPC